MDVAIVLLQLSLWVCYINFIINIIFHSHLLQVRDQFIRAFLRQEMKVLSVCPSLTAEKVSHFMTIFIPVNTGAGNSDSDCCLTACKLHLQTAVLSSCILNMDCCLKKHACNSELLFYTTQTQPIALMNSIKQQFNKSNPLQLL